MIDPDYQRETVQVIRQQSDTSTEPGEQSLSPLGLWRRSQESWHHGAGQDFLDGKSEQAADPHRFRSSKGVDVWTRGQFSLLHPTLKVWSTANANLHLAVALEAATGNFVLYAADGNELYYNALPFSALNTLALQQGSGWTAANATIAVEGGYYFRLTATANDAVSATSPTGTSGFPVDAGRRYAFTFISFYASGGAAKTPRINVTWYTAAGAVISSTTPVVAAGDDATDEVLIADATAPATAAFASMTVSYTANWVVGEIHHVRNAAFGPYDLVEALGASDVWQVSGIQAGQAAQPVQSIVTNGSYVWAALGISGLHRTAAYAATSTADVPAAPVGGQIHLVGYANGFLLAAGSTTSTTGKNTLWRVGSPLTAPLLSVIKTHDNPNFEWVGIGHGRSCVYAFGNSGGNGEIYKVTFDANTGTLSTAASPATYLPDGETIHSLQFYAGGIIMGTGKGVRLGQADGAGNIDYGRLVETEWPVRCLEPQSQWCWFGWTKYDASNSGLGRVDLGYFTDTLTPAWASDLMTDDTSQGDVVSCVTFAPYGYTADQRPPVRVFTVAGEGVYIEDPYSRVPEGVLETGTIRFATSEPKMARSLDMRHHALPATSVVVVAQQPDSNGVFSELWSYSAPGAYGPVGGPLDMGSVIAEAFEYQFKLRTGNPTDYTASPEITRWTLKALPLPSTIDETFTLNLHMKSTVDTTAGDGQPYHIDVPTEVAFLKGLERSRAVVEMQLGDDVHDVYVLSSKFVGDHWDSPLREFSEGMLQLVCQTVRG